MLVKTYGLFCKILKIYKKRQFSIKSKIPTFLPRIKFLRQGRTFGALFLGFLPHYKMVKIFIKIINFCNFYEKTLKIVTF